MGLAGALSLPQHKTKNLDISGPVSQGPQRTRVQALGYGTQAQQQAETGQHGVLPAPMGGAHSGDPQTPPQPSAAPHASPTC